MMAIPLRQRVELDELALTGEMTYGEYVEIKRKRRERSMSILRSVQRGSKGSKRVRKEPRTAKLKGQAPNSHPSLSVSGPDYEPATPDMHVPESSDAATFHGGSSMPHWEDLGEPESPIQEYVGAKEPSRSESGAEEDLGRKRGTPGLSEVAKDGAMQYRTTEESPMPELSHTFDTEGTPASDLSDMHNTTVTELPGPHSAKGDSPTETTVVYEEGLMSDIYDSREADDALSYLSNDGGEAAEATPQTPDTPADEAMHSTLTSPSTTQGPTDWSKLPHGVGQDVSDDTRNNQSRMGHLDQRLNYDDSLEEPFDYSVFHSPTPEPFEVNAPTEEAEKRESVAAISDDEDAMEESGRDETSHLDREVLSEQEADSAHELVLDQEADMSEDSYSSAAVHHESEVDEVLHEDTVREADLDEGTDIVHEVITGEKTISDQEIEEENASDAAKTTDLGETVGPTSELGNRDVILTDLTEKVGLVSQPDDARTSRTPESESIENEAESITASVLRASDSVHRNAYVAHVQETFDSTKLSFKSPRIKTPLFLNFTPKTRREDENGTETTGEDGNKRVASDERGTEINPLSHSSDPNTGVSHTMETHGDSSESEGIEQVSRVGKLSFKSPRIKQPVYFNLMSRVTQESTFDRGAFTGAGNISDDQESDYESQPEMEEVLETNTSEPLNDLREESLSDNEREPEMGGEAENSDASVMEDANDLEVEQQHAPFPRDADKEQAEEQEPPQEAPLADDLNTKQAVVVETLPEPITDMAALTEGVALDALFDEFPEDDSFSDDPQGSPSPSYSSRGRARLSSISQGASDDEDLFPVDVFSRPDGITSDVDIDEREIGPGLQATYPTAKTPDLESGEGATPSHETPAKSKKTPAEYTGTPAERIQNSDDGMQSSSDEELEAPEDHAVNSVEKSLLSTNSPEHAGDSVEKSLSINSSTISPERVSLERVSNLADVTNSMAPSISTSRNVLGDSNLSRMSPLKHALEEEEFDVLGDSNESRHKRIRIGSDTRPFNSLNSLAGLAGDSQMMVEIEPASDSTSSSRDPARLHEGLIVSGALTETTTTFVGHGRRFSSDHHENEYLGSAQPLVQGAAHLSSMTTASRVTMTDTAVLQSPDQERSAFREDFQIHQHRVNEQTDVPEVTERQDSFSGFRSDELEDGRLEASDSHNQYENESGLSVADELIPDDGALDEHPVHEAVSQDTSLPQRNVVIVGENVSETGSVSVNDDLPSPGLGDNLPSHENEVASPQNGPESHDIEHFLAFEDDNIEEEGNTHGPSYSTPDYGPEENISSVPEEVDEGPEEPLYETYADEDEFVIASGDEQEVSYADAPVEELDSGYADAPVEELDSGYVDAQDVGAPDGQEEASEEDLGRFEEIYSHQEDPVGVQESNEFVGDSNLSFQEQRNDTQDSGNGRAATPPSSDMNYPNENRTDFEVVLKREETPEMPMDSSPTPSVARSIRRSSNASMSDRQDVNINQHRSTPSLDLNKPVTPLSPQGSDNHETREDSVVQENSLVVFNPTENWTKLHWRELERSLIHEERRSNINLKFNAGTTYDVDYDRIIREFRHNVQVPGDFFDEATLIKRIKALQIRRARDVVRWSRGITPRSAKTHSRIDNSLRYLSLSIKRVTHFDHLDDRSFDDSILNDTFNT